MANAAVEVTQVAGNSKDLAGDLFAAQQAKLNTKPAKPAKSFAAPSASAPSLPSFSAPSLPSFSVPSFGSKKDAAPKAEAPKKEAAAKSSSGSSEGLNLGLVMAVLFSPLLVVQAVTFGTFARLAGGKK
ncbi:unnamed product [Ostreococcus tauri]|nr:unnamed product [Ostreococcus tauri]CEG01631.1 unnamed product [Ostreococcus tauri]|eukprot:XP_003080976.2 unnamed product [Ostreococcus tauri]